jgi:hypothetical protein
MRISLKFKIILQFSSNYLSCFFFCWGINSNFSNNASKLKLRGTFFEVDRGGRQLMLYSIFVELKPSIQ